eukprot:1270763-Rhodomonas_salina.1
MCIRDRGRGAQRFIWRSDSTLQRHMGQPSMERCRSLAQSEHMHRCRHGSTAMLLGFDLPLKPAIRSSSPESDLRHAGPSAPSRNRADVSARARLTRERVTEVRRVLARQAKRSEREEGGEGGRGR